LKGVASESECEKIGKLERELMGFGVHRGSQLYMHDMYHSAVIRFPRQRFVSIRLLVAARQRGCGKQAGPLWRCRK
jgi:hypothetical protein